jgi:hypothetical protein
MVRRGERDGLAPRRDRTIEILAVPGNLEPPQQRAPEVRLAAGEVRVVRWDQGHGLAPGPDGLVDVIAFPGQLEPGPQGGP